MPKVKVTPKPGLFPDGTAVQAFLARETDVERREGRVPIPDPAANGVIASGSVEIEAASGSYVLTGVVDELQSVKVEAKKGTFKLKFEGKETAAIKYNATAKEVEEALVALENIAAGEVEVTGGPGDETGSKPYVVKFLGSWSGKNVGAMTADASGLEEGVKKATVSTSTEGSKAGAGGVQRTCLFTIP